ncbi:MAG: c-type cytochrome [Gammaproteobacteria bacterium]|nr:c-type cytochrome [Gammaproteobacteria bacterium]
MKSTIIIATAVAALGFGLNASAADQNAAVKAKNLCAACHGPQGISVNPLWPNIAGQKADYLQKAMRDYKNGTRNDPLMTPIGTTLSDSDIAGLAAYYAALPAGG